MGNLYENIISLCKKKGIKGGRMCTDIGISKGILTDLKMGRQTGVSAATAQKIASYFGVTVAHLLGEEENEKEPATSGDGLSDEEIRFIKWYRTQASEKDKAIVRAIVNADDR